MIKAGDLLEFRERIITLTKKYYKYNAIETGDSITSYEIESSANSYETVEYIGAYFKKLIEYYSINNIKYDELVLLPIISIFVKEEDLDENLCLKDNAGVLDEYVSIFIPDFKVINDEESVYTDPHDVFSGDLKEYIVQFKDLIRELRFRGYEYNGVEDFNTLKREILSDNQPVIEIIISFNKNKTLIYQ